MQILCQGHSSRWLEEATTFSEEGCGIAAGRGIEHGNLRAHGGEQMGEAVHGKLGAQCNVAVPDLSLLTHMTRAIPNPHPKPRFPSVSGNERSAVFLV